MTALVLRNVEVAGRPGLDVRLEHGRIAAIAPGLPRAPDEIDGRGGALIPGLCDHHIHLLALAARRASVDLSDARSPDEVAARLAAAPPGPWIRALGHHEALMGDLTRADLDRMAPGRAVRVQHQTGALWTLSSAALARLPADDDPPGLDRASGRLFRGDAWLRSRLPDALPDLAPIGRALAACGVTALTDASVTTDATAAAHLADAHRRGDLPQRLMLMSGGALAAPDDAAFAVGPLKVLLDDHALPDFDLFLARIADARAWGRAVAVHCVTAAELALTLAVFQTAGARPGDRIEHGSVIAPEALAAVRDLGLTVVTQSVFVAERGDRYLAEVDPRDQPDLYRGASLLAAGIPLAASSDAPYADPDPWRGIAAAIHRRTASGQVLGPAERLAPERALGLYLDAQDAPGRRARTVSVGAAADLGLLHTPLAAALEEPQAAHVRATFIAGAPVHLT